MQQSLDQKLCLEFQKYIDHFIKDIVALKSNKHLPKEGDFLSQVATHITHLNERSIKVSQIKENEDVQEVGQIVQGIINQVLRTKNHKTITFLKAAEKQLAGHSEVLSDIMQEYLNHPEATNTFILELEHLAHDLNGYLKKSA